MILVFTTLYEFWSCLVMHIANIVKKNMKLHIKVQTHMDIETSNLHTITFTVYVMYIPTDSVKIHFI